MQPLSSDMTDRDLSFAPFLNLYPGKVLELPIQDIITLLSDRYGQLWDQAIQPENTIPSPLAGFQNTAWLKRANCTGINVRTIDGFWNIIPYALTLPKAQNAIHILPIWEPGVVGSLYGMSSWNINPEFFSDALYEVYPHLDSVEKQLKVVINILHLLGKAVGMDVVPHTDRFAEQVLANPGIFEWLQRKNTAIVRHDSGLFRDVETQIFFCLQQMGPAVEGVFIPEDSNSFFYDLEESTRLLMLFGYPEDYWGRLERRKVMIHWLYEFGFETVPATMAPPYRGLEVDPDEKAMVIDEDGRTWRDYRITQPQKMSRVFGPLSRYKLYESKDDNVNWELDFSRPAYASWAYTCAHYLDIQQTYNFDFMRGDMSHVQMRPDGVPAHPDAFYDLLAAVKTTVLESTPWFGYFAESFMAPAGEMAFGDEYDHLEASLADSTLGDLQSEPVGTETFVKEFARYRAVLEHRKFAPNFTILTADKDDPRFDKFYLTGNEIRYFIALFLPDMPSYMALGFEGRDVHETAAPNEHYTKLYVFQEKNGPKSTKGPYQWGKNYALYDNLVRQKNLSEEIGDSIASADVEWHIKPDPTGKNKIIAWSAGGFLFYANLDTTSNAVPQHLPAGTFFRFSTIDDDEASARIQQGNPVLRAGEGWVLEYHK